jgi:hypothetical protein
VQPWGYRYHDGEVIRFHSRSGAEHPAHRAAIEADSDRLAGDSGDTARARFAAYNAERAYLYGLEQRFADAPFWEARRLATARALCTAPADHVIDG